MSEGKSAAHTPGPCAHDLAERETACADGMCPLCLCDELTELRRLLKVSQDIREELRAAIRAYQLSAESQRK